MDLAGQISRTLASHDDVIAGWLFGSQARGAARPDSDVDVAVLLDTEPAATLEGQRFDLAAELEASLGQPVDLVIVNRASADLVHRVLRDGLLVRDRDRARRIAFEVKKRAEYLDMLPVWREIRRKAMRLP